MKIRISRSFSRKLQLKPYEPVESFCAAEAEMEVDTDWLPASPEHQKDISDMSDTLDKFCREEVEKTLNTFKATDHTKAKDAARNTAEIETIEEP